MSKKYLFLALVAAAGCANEKPAADDTFTDLQGLDEKSDSFSYRMKIVGSLDYGQTSDAVKYTSSPRYRAFKFAGNENDSVSIDVKSTNGGDAVAWLLDNDFNVIASNDDANANTVDSHIDAKLPANASATHYVVFRDYYLSKATFKVTLKGTAAAVDLYSCQTDSDCVRVQKGCCAAPDWAAVKKGEEKAYHDSLKCPQPTICPAIAYRDDHSQAECISNKCQAVKPADIHCGGFIAPAMQHQCPAQWKCQLKVSAPDTGGSCVQECGGIAGFGCDDLNQTCVDDPSDSCDPANGGADCMGICQTPPPPPPPTADCRTTGCGSGQYCTFCWVKYQCIPNGALC